MSAIAVMWVIGTGLFIIGVALDWWFNGEGL